MKNTATKPTTNPNTPATKQLTKRKLSLKQQMWKKAYIETGNATEAAMRVYNCKNRNVAQNIGYENVAKLGFDTLLEEVGVTDVLLAKKAKKGLEAKKIQRDYETGEIVEVDDHQTQYKYWESSLKLKGRLNNNKADGGTNVSVQVLNQIKEQENADKYRD